MFVLHSHACVPRSLHHVLLPLLCLYKGATSDRFLAFTQSSFSGLGMVRTHLLLTSNLDVAALQTAHIGEYLSIAAQTSGGLQVRGSGCKAARVTSAYEKNLFGGIHALQ